MGTIGENKRVEGRKLENKETREHLKHDSTKIC
jgi:hypothetical protein